MSENGQVRLQEASKDVSNSETQDKTQPRQDKDGSEHDSLPHRPHISDQEGEHEVVASPSHNLQPVLRPKEDPTVLDKEPETSQIRHENNSKQNENAKSEPVVAPEQHTGVQEASSGPESPKQAQKGSKSVKNGKKASLKFVLKKPKKWNPRFYLTEGIFQPGDGANKLFENTRSFRQFNKGRKPEVFTKLKTIEKDVGAQTHRQFFPALKHSRHRSMEDLLREKKWNQRFNITNSKNNNRVFNDYKEFFDKPIHYDARGYHFTPRPAPMMVYENEAGKPDIVNPKFDKIKRKQLKKRLIKERGASHRSRVRELSKTSFWASSNPSQAGLTNNVAFTSSLRTQMAAQTSRKGSSKKKQWDPRFAVPVSTFNEAVYKKYKVPFEAL
ncbi:unnamed protein product [Moneuplotes crassus]|uniref:Uncharacterized protein n=2 Tax=Euplotes crassus TaxID=5936 RepID=A0AAD1XHP8_EUPCR|nr:unnamed protein product [Moneuplotes crassus]